MRHLLRAPVRISVMGIAFQAVHAIWREAAAPHPGMAETGAH